MVISLVLSIRSVLMTGLSQSQAMVSYNKQDDLEERELSIDDAKVTDYGPTTSDSVSPSEGGLRAWLVVLGV